MQVILNRFLPRLSGGATGGGTGGGGESRLRAASAAPSYAAAKDDEHLVSAIVEQPTGRGGGLRAGAAPTVVGAR